MFTVEEILKATEAKLLQGKADRRLCGISIDSRTVKPNQLFVAIRGERFDGHNFISAARQKGAGAFLFSDDSYLTKALDFNRRSPCTAIKVTDTIEALGALAHYHRMKFNIPVIAITGTSGKTTTKEMLSAILRRKFCVLCNQGTQNNLIGVPLTIFKLHKRHNLVVVELGANHAGEIERLSWIVKPTLGVLTKIGPAHLEFFKTMEGVFKAKLELIKNLAKNGKLVINKDDRFLAKLKNGHFKIISFGLSRLADFSGEIIQRTEKDTTFLLNKRQRIVMKALGQHNVYNALASIAVARNFGISLCQIKDSLALFRPLPLRMQMLKIKDVKIINDCYNSNPDSLSSALEFLKEFPNRKIAVCGDMLELGPAARKLHLEIGKKIPGYQINCLITIGKLAKSLACGARLAGMGPDSIYTCEGYPQAVSLLRKIACPDDIVLIKGSRAMQMENIVKCFTGSSTH